MEIEQRDVTNIRGVTTTFEHLRDNRPAIKLSSPPSAPIDGNEYYDDGTNTSSGTEGIRKYIGGA